MFSRGTDMEHWLEMSFEENVFVKIILSQQICHQVDTHMVRFSGNFHNFIANAFIPISH